MNEAGESYETYNERCRGVGSGIVKVGNARSGGDALDDESGHPSHHEHRP